MSLKYDLFTASKTHAYELRFYQIIVFKNMF